LVNYWTLIGGQSELDLLGSECSTLSFVASKAGKTSDFFIVMAAPIAIPSITKQEAISSGWMQYFCH